MNLYDKTDETLVQMHFGFSTVLYSSIGVDTTTNKEQEFRDDEIVDFDNTPVKSLQKYAFSIKSYQVCVKLYFNILCNYS